MTTARRERTTTTAIARIVLAALAAVAASAVHAAGAAPIGADGARHLLARTGFGPTAAEIAGLAPLGRSEAVDRVLATARTTPVLVPPSSMTADGPLRPAAGASEEARRAFLREQFRLGIELRGWWVAEMFATDSPLTERMTLFWHNHFVSSQQKVRVAKLMYRQNALLRAHALGDFGALLHAVSKDPAMLVYLDGVQNRRAAPNENFAREVMELFTLGEGRYSETDVKEAARAFSGWSLDRDTGAFVFRPLLHDRGEKTVLGRTERFDGDGVLDLLLAQPATAEHVVSKLWREFVSPEPDAAEVKRIAAAFRASGYRIPVALRALLSTDAFWAEANRGVLVKSPVELVVGALRTVGATPDDARPFAFAIAGMGQNLFSPPNVKGWRGGEAWIDASTLLARKAFLERLARYEEPAAATMGAMRPPAADAMARVPRSAIEPAGMPVTAEGDADAQTRARLAARALDRAFRELDFPATRFVASMPGATPGEKRVYAQAVLLPIAPAGSGGEALRADEPLAFLRSTMLDPAFQLK